jgi:hypothetical protein
MNLKCLVLHLVLISHIGVKTSKKFSHIILAAIDPYMFKKYGKQVDEKMTVIKRRRKL